MLQQIVFLLGMHSYYHNVCVWGGVVKARISH